MNVWVVIPAYNEVSTIRDVAARALAQCANVVVVDDGSADGTSQALTGLGATVLRNEANQGKAASLCRGIAHACERGAKAVVTLDADGQHCPEDIPRFVEAAQRAPGHIVIGSRMQHANAFPRKRLFGNKFANFWISWAAGYFIEDSQSGFRLYPAALFSKVAVPHGRERSFVFESEILIEAARRAVFSIPISISAIYHPAARASHFHSVLDVVRITRMVAWKLFSRALYLQGFVRAFIFRRASALIFSASNNG
jgi:glycosyltransferase involved in cell wall biosynthesis